MGIRGQDRWNVSHYRVFPRWVGCGLGLDIAGRHWTVASRTKTRKSGGEVQTWVTRKGELALPGRLMAR
jgi:hypothetical protein